MEDVEGEIGLQTCRLQFADPCSTPVVVGVNKPHARVLSKVYYVHFHLDLMLDTFLFLSVLVVRLQESVLVWCCQKTYFNFPVFLTLRLRLWSNFQLSLCLRLFPNNACD